MINEKFKQALSKSYPYARKCSFCRLDPEHPSWEDVDKLLSCNVCMLDFDSLGYYSSNAMGFLANLYQRDPSNLRWKLLNKLFDEMEKARGGAVTTPYP